MGRNNTLTIHEIYAALMPSDSRSDWASEFAAGTCSSDINPTYFPVSDFILLTVGLVFSLKNHVSTLPPIF